MYNLLTSIYVSYIPAKEEKASKEARIPQAIINGFRTKRAQATTSQGTSQAHHGLTAMLKKKFRLHTSAFNEVFNFGQTKRNDLFLLKKKDTTLPYSRFAVVVSKKIAKKAFERNYLRRKFMHAIGEKMSTFDTADYIFVLNSSAKDVEYKDLVASLDSVK